MEIPIIDTFTCPFSSVACVCICWRKQKKQTEWQETSFLLHDSKNPKLSLLAADFWIIQCTTSFGQQPTHPHSICPSDNLSIPFKFITSANTTALITLQQHWFNTYLPTNLISMHSTPMQFTSPLLTCSNFHPEWFTFAHSIPHILTQQPLLLTSADFPHCQEIPPARPKQQRRWEAFNLICTYNSKFLACSFLWPYPFAIKGPSIHQDLSSSLPTTHISFTNGRSNKPPGIAQVSVLRFWIHLHKDLVGILQNHYSLS